jgi:hypothetical protein
MILKYFNLNKIDIKIIVKIHNKMDEYVTQYMASLNKDQLKIIEIAKKELGTSFDIKKVLDF